MTIVAVLAGAFIWVNVGGKEGNGPASAGASSTASEPTVPPSSSDDWFEAICAPGTFDDGGAYQSLPNSSGGTAQCRSTYIAIAGRASGPMVYIGSYDSQYKLEQDILRKGTYATMATSVGDTILFVIPSGIPQSKPVLAPLERFGFKITVRN
ncbi:hypothetical protein ACWEQ4_06615 [Rhodococcus sp. NPDC003994]